MKRIGYVIFALLAVLAHEALAQPVSSPYRGAFSTTPVIDPVLILPGTVSSSVFGFLAGTTSPLQTQINLKAPSANPVFSGSITGTYTIAGTPTLGASLTTTDNTFGIGDTTHRFTQLGVISILSGATSLNLTSNVADGASAIGLKFYNTTALANATARIASFGSNLIEKAAILSDGSVVVNGIGSSTGSIHPLPTGISPLVALDNSRLPPTPSGAGKIIYDNGTTYVANAAGTTTQTLHGGTTPGFSAVVLTTDVSGILPAANGGSGVTSVSGTAMMAVHVAPSTASTTDRSAALAANSGSNAFTGISSPGSCRELSATFGLGWDGGNVTINGSDCSGVAQTVVLTASAGATVNSGVGWSTLTSASKATVGASAATATIGTTTGLGVATQRRAVSNVNPATIVAVNSTTFDTAGISSTAGFDPIVKPTTSVPNGSRNFTIMVRLN